MIESQIDFKEYKIDIEYSNDYFIDKKFIIIHYGGSFNPFGLHHENVIHITWKFIKSINPHINITFIISPCYHIRKDKQLAQLSAEKRYFSIFNSVQNLNTIGIDCIINWHDINKKEYTPAVIQHSNILAKYPNMPVIQLWGSDLDLDNWQQPSLVKTLPNILFQRKNQPVTSYPNTHAVVYANLDGSSSEINEYLSRKEYTPLKNLLCRKNYQLLTQ